MKIYFCKIIFHILFMYNYDNIINNTNMIKRKILVVLSSDFLQRELLKITRSDIEFMAYQISPIIYTQINYWYQFNFNFNMFKYQKINRKFKYYN